jgi:hypothetical protein
MREKRHWENQIVALGGANYRRNVAMLDDDGKEVPGTKGYKFVAIAPLVHDHQTHTMVLGTLAVLKSSLVCANSSKAGKRKKRKKIRPCHITKSL